MKKKKLIKNNLISQIKIYLLTKHNLVSADKEKIINQLIEGLKSSKIGYAGFSKKNYLKEFLYFQIFNSEVNFRKTKKRNLDKREITKITINVMEKCTKVLPSPVTNIFIFPSYNTFVKEKMKGVSGYTPWRNTMLIFIDPTIKTWKQALRLAIVHEYVHTVSRQYHKWENLLDSIIFEGLAENFCKKILNKASPWSSSLGLAESQKYLKKIYCLLNSKDKELHRLVFFADQEYPRWSGYAIGYHIVKKFLDSQPGYDWSRIIKLKPKEIFLNSNFIKKARK